jgi:non-heme chloroperoxidase
VPIVAAGLKSAKIIKGVILKVYKGAPHAIPIVRQDELNADLLTFIKG